MIAWNGVGMILFGPSALKILKLVLRAIAITVSALLNIKVIKDGKRHKERKELGGHKKKEREGREQGPELR